MIRVDHGTPLRHGAGPLIQLEHWWIEQGIAVEFTHLASPQDNGSHERMHRDLKAEAITHPQPTRPPSSAALSAGATPIIMSGHMSHWINNGPVNFTDPVRAGSMRATNRSCIRQT